MLLDPIIWALGFKSDKVVTKLAEWVTDKRLSDELRVGIKQWTAGLPEILYLHPDALFPDLVPYDELAERPGLSAVRAALRESRLPTVQQWEKALLEQWITLSAEGGDNLQPFFRASESDVRPYLSDLAKRIDVICSKSDLI